MSDLTERFIRRIDEALDKAWERRPKDFIEWEAADEIERLKAELFTMRNVFHQQDAEIERLREGCPASNDVDCLKERCKAADEIELLKAECEGQKIGIAILRDEIERLEAVREAHVDEICEKNIEIERLQAVVDAAREIVEGPHKNWPKLREALAALEGGDDLL